MQALGFFLLGIVAWMAALLTIPFIALQFWHHGVGRLPKWAVHILFAPIAFAVEWVLLRLIFFAAHDDGSGPPGLGLILILPLAIFVGTVITYYVAVSYVAARAFWRSANVR